MEAKLGFSGYNAYQCVYMKTITQTESQDCVVPDTLPDIASVMITSGCVLIRSKDVAEGHARLEANVPARICFAGEGDAQICSLDVNIPFYISAEDDAIRSDCVCCANLTLQHLETRLLNPRKISVRAEVCAEIRCFAEGSEMFQTGPSEEGGAIHALEAEAELTSISCVTEKTFVLTDEFELPQEQDAAVEILAQNADVFVQEQRNVGTKLIVKGYVRSELVFQTEKNDAAALAFQTSFSQIIETATEAEDCLYETQMLISGMYYELTPASDGRAISMELHLVAQAVVYTRQRIRYLLDAYSNIYDLSLCRISRESVRFGREVILRDSCTSAIELPGEVKSVIACRAGVTSCINSGKEFSLQLALQICWRGESMIRSAERMLSHRITLDPESESIKVCCVTVQDVYAAPGAGGAELRIQLEVKGFTAQTVTLDAIESIAYEEDAQKDTDGVPTLVLLRPGKDCSLWDMAKENCSTVDAIRAANGLEDGAPLPEHLLLIPKTL